MSCPSIGQSAGASAAIEGYQRPWAGVPTVAARGGIAMTQLRGARPEVARRAGHGVAVLLKIYAHCIDGQADAANQRITDALGTKDTPPESGDEEDGDSEKAS